MSALGDRTTESRTGVLVYTDVKRCGRAAQTGSGSATPRDMHNYLVTCPTIDGE
jgi:xylan 1,4-beta-xylosidase